MKVTHKANCKRVFKCYDLSCPRCLELNEGASPRAGWNDLQKRNEAMRLDAIRTHDFAACAKKNIICTCFEY